MIKQIRDIIDYLLFVKNWQEDARVAHCLLTVPYKIIIMNGSGAREGRQFRWEGLRASPPLMQQPTINNGLWRPSKTRPRKLFGWSVLYIYLFVADRGANPGGFRGWKKLGHTPLFYYNTTSITYIIFQLFYYYYLHISRYHGRKTWIKVQKLLPCFVLPAHVFPLHFECQKLNQGASFNPPLLG